MIGFLAIFIGGGSGALVRYFLATLFSRLSGYGAVPVSFPMGILCVNILGCFIMGLAMAYWADRMQLLQGWRLLVVTGFLGGFTTFSAFSFEAVSLLERGLPFQFVIYMLLSVIGSIIACAVGMFLGRIFL